MDTSSREQVREFYNAVYTSSDGVPINSTAVTASCFPGTNSPAFVSATLRRINWFRALAGIPAAVTFDADECAKDQAAALMMCGQRRAAACRRVGRGGIVSVQTEPMPWPIPILALGNDGPDAITAYIWDFGPEQL